MAIFPKNYCTISIKLNHFFLLQRVVSQKGGWDGWPVAIWKRKKILNNPINFVLWIKVNVCIALLWIVNFTYIVQFTLASHITFFNIRHHQKLQHIHCALWDSAQCAVRTQCTALPNIWKTSATTQCLKMHLWKTDGGWVTLLQQLCQGHAKMFLGMKTFYQMFQHPGSATVL